MPGISFHYPQVFVLLLLLPLAWRYLVGRRNAVSSWLRLAIPILAVLALAQPRIGRTGPETDLIIMVDRSASCQGDAERMLRELLPLVRQGERPGDRTAVVAFGDGAIVERGFAADAVVGLAPDHFEFASDLSAGLRLAAAMRSPERRTAVLCLTDGLYTGVSPLSPEVLPALAGTPFWYRRLGAGSGLDVAAGPIVTPEEVEPRSAWLVRYTIIASGPAEAGYSLSRNGYEIAQGTARLRRGENHFFVRDTVDSDTILEYRLEVRAGEDGVPQNNASRSVLRVAGPPRVLLVAYRGGESGLLARSLRAAAIPVDVVKPEDFPATASLLSPYRLVILENARLSDLPGQGVASLAEAVGAGVAALLVTGGPNSFGQGGYHRSPLDPLLPVELELRNDIRRGNMALAMALDRSGSMAIPVDDTMTKMDLANLGAAESIRLLANRDQVSVIAVDSAPHIVVPLSHVDDPSRLAELTLRIQAMGGGIYCLTALQAAAEQVRKSGLPSRHIILFADAADAEEQDGCLELARELRAENIFVSVVAMGTEADSDAQFLIDLAKEGGGECLFADYATGLPALFTQEVMRISRRGFLEEAVSPRLLSPMHLLGLINLSTPPGLLGYNVSGLRDGAIAFMDMEDEFHTPLLATRVNGRAAVGAILFEVDGKYSGDFAVWPESPSLLVALARRLAGGVHSIGLKSYSRLDKGNAEVEYEFSPEIAGIARGQAVQVKWLGPEGVTLATEVEWVQPETVRSRAALDIPGHYLPFLDIGELGTAAAPPVSVSYSSEFDVRDHGAGWTLLADLAEATGGGDGLDFSQVRESADVVRPGGVAVRPYLLAAIVVLFLVEVSGRRLLWFR